MSTTAVAYSIRHRAARQGRVVEVAVPNQPLRHPALDKTCFLLSRQLRRRGAENPDGRQDPLPPGDYGHMTRTAASVKGPSGRARLRPSHRVVASRVLLLAGPQPSIHLDGKAEEGSNGRGDAQDVGYRVERGTPQETQGASISYLRVPSTPNRHGCSRRPFDGRSRPRRCQRPGAFEDFPAISVFARMRSLLELGRLFTLAG